MRFIFCQAIFPSCQKVLVFYIIWYGADINIVDFFLIQALCVMMAWISYGNSIFRVVSLFIFSDSRSKSTRYRYSNVLME